MSDVVWKTPELVKKLQALLTEDGPERGGFILPRMRNRIVEMDNIHPNPMDGYNPSPRDILKYADDAVASWHTHPRSSANLSVEDFNTFVQWANIEHIIVGNDGVRFYKVKGKAVVNSPLMGKRKLT